MNTDIRDAAWFALISNILAIIGASALAFAGHLPQPLQMTIIADGYLLMLGSLITFMAFVANVVVAIYKSVKPQ